MKPSREHYASAPIPKPVRVRDESVLDWARNRGECEVCGRVRPTEPHHLRSVGAGGGDEWSNICAVCRECHDRAHRGLIPRERLREIVSGRC